MKKVLLATLVVGALDITEVLLFYWFRGVAPTRVLKGIAAGIMGIGAAREGGTEVALLGLGLHYLITFFVVTVYFVASSNLKILREKPVLMGALYGLAVWAVMSYVVIPMSLIGPSPRLFPPWPMLANTLFAHVFCVGIPTALFARRAYSSSSSSGPALLYFLVLL